MKKYIVAFIGLALAWSCTESPAGKAETKSDLPETVFYILHSSAGNTIWSQSLSELVPFDARIFVTEAGDAFVDIVANYQFLEYEDGPSHTFSLSFSKVPVQGEKGSRIATASGLTGTCAVDGRTAEFVGASLKGSIGKESASLTVEGMVNGYPFTLKVDSAVPDANAFVPAMLNSVDVARLPLMEMEIENGTSAEVSVNLQCPVEPERNETLSPGETIIFLSRVEEYPKEMVVSVSYADGTTHTASGSELLSSSFLQRGALEERWMPDGSPSGAIEPICFHREHFIVTK